MRKQYNPIIIPQINQSTEAVSSANCGTHCKLFKGIEESSVKNETTKATRPK